MKEICDEIYFLSQDELIVLLAAKGFQSVYLLNHGNLALEENDILYTINRLFQNGIIDGVNEKFRICEPLSTMLMNLYTAKKLIILRKVQQGIESICVYQNEMSCTVLHWDEQRRDKIQIYAQNLQEVKELFKEYVKNESFYVPTLEEESSFRYIMEDTKPISIERLTRYRNIPLFLEIMDLNKGKVQEKTCIQIKEKEKIIFNKKANQQESYPYDEEAMKKQIDALLRGNQK